MSDADPAPKFEMPCRYLRTNKMFHGAPDEVDDDTDAGSWCEKTRETFGPDGEDVGKSDCGSDRTCYQTY